MVVATMEIKMYAPWVSSLKEKRMQVRSILGKVRNKYNVSVAEVDTQDIHQTITIGLSCVSNSRVQVEKVLQDILNYMESNFEAEIVSYEIEII